MSDIFQEVEEDLRRERLKKVWDRYGIFVIIAAVVIVVVTAGWRGYEAWQTGRDRAAGDAFTAALVEAESAGTATAAENLLAFAEDAPGGYRMLARFRAATAYAQAEQPEAARETFAALAADGSLATVYRDLARIRLAQLQIDAGLSEEAQSTVAAMAEDTSNPFNKSAQELMGLAAYAADDMDEAYRWFTSVRDAAGTPAGLRARAEFMIALIAQSTEIASKTPAAPASQETN